MLAPLGGTRFEGWEGLEVEKGEATLRVPGKAEFEYPRGPKGWYEEGFRKENDGTEDWSGYYGVQLEVRAPADRTLMLEATLVTPSTDPAPNSGRNEFILESNATVKVAGDGNWKTITLPWLSFDYNKSQGPRQRWNRFDVLPVESKIGLPPRPADYINCERSFRGLSI